jgi:hypothetical protein
MALATERLTRFRAPMSLSIRASSRANPHHRNHGNSRPDFGALAPRRLSSMGSIPDLPPQTPAIAKENPVKELALDEVLAIAGGLPPGVALDEIFYRAPAEPVRDPMAFAELAVDDGAASLPR